MMKITKADFKSLVVEAVQQALGEADDETVEVEIGKKPQSYYHGAGSRANTPEKKEAEALFNYFFDDLQPEALEFMIHNDPQLEEIVVQMYGWNLFDFRRVYPHPGTDTLVIANEFKEEGKEIIDNEEEFLQRLEQHQYAKGKEAFEKAKEQGEESPGRNVPVGRSATPGTAEYSDIQRLLKLAGQPESDPRGTAPTVFSPRRKKR